MPTELNWIARPAAAAWYWLDAAEIIGPTKSLPHQEQLAEAQHTWREFLAAQKLGWSVVSPVLLPLSAEYDSPAALAGALLPRLMPRDLAKVSAPTWSNALRVWEQSFAEHQPQVGHELQLRIGPIRELAEACLPGLLRLIGRLSDPLLLPEQVRVVVVPPYRGGHSCSFAANNTILWEGLLVNVQSQLPEVLRLAWSIAQLNLEVPTLIGELPRAVSGAAGAWATIPLVLQAGAELEQCRCEQATVQLAADTWLPPQMHGLSAAQTASVVWQWWETYAAARPAWPVALGALAAMLDNAAGLNRAD